MSDDYGGFTMPDKDFFYLSSMYSDKLLTDFLPVAKNKAYQRYMQIQKDILNSNEICGSLVMNSNYKYYFKESLELNEYFGFPLGSIYADITEQNFYLDIGDKLKFIRKFKNFNTPISSTDIMENPDIFTHVIRCTIGDYYFNKFYIMKDKYQRVYIGIKNSSTEGLSTTVLQRLISEGTESNPTTFCLWKDIPSAVYQYNGPLSSIMFSSTTSGMKKVNIPKSNSISNLSPTIDNNWMLIMTYAGTKFGNYVYTSTNVSLTSESKTTLSFDVPIVFLNDIGTRNVSVSCMAIQRPNRKSIFAYNPTSDSEPWLSLGDVDRPVSIANIKIYAYDEATASYKRRIPIEMNNFNQEFNLKVKIDSYNENDFFSNIIFPSIYKFEDINIPIRIELIEFISTISNTTFDNNIKSLFTYNGTSEIDYNADHYLEYLTWLNLNTSHATYGTKITNTLNKLTGFNPINVYMDYDDYMASGKTLREYKFGKLMQLIASDPYIYADYIKFMDRQNFNIIRESGSPKYFKFNTGITTNKDLTGSNLVVTDDSFTCVNKNDEVFFFSEPHSYIKIHSDNPDAWCMVFVGGRMISPTRIKSKLNDIYIFIPQSTMKKYVEEAMAKLNEQSDTLLNTNNLITVELYPKVNRSTSNQVYFTNVFDATYVTKKLFNGDRDFTYKLSDLVIYNKTTGEYIPLSKFDITATLYKATIKFEDEITDVVVGSTDEIIYMGTNLGEVYMTKDNLRIILEDEVEEYKFPTDDSEYGGRSDEYCGYQNKEWAASDLAFQINDPKLAGSEIEFVYSPVSYSWDIPFEKFTKNESTGKYTYQLGGFITRNNIKLFELFINGEYLEADKYLTMPNGVGTDDRIIITLPENISTWYTSTSKVIQLRYNPTTYMKETGTKKTILSKYSPQFGSNPIDYNYSVFNTPLYECLDTNHYMNSDNSRVYVYKENMSGDVTGVSLPYTWNIGKEKIDLQSLMNVSILHPVMKYTPILRDLDRDVSFITNSKGENARSVVDYISLDYDD